MHHLLLYTRGSVSLLIVYTQLRPLCPRIHFPVCLCIAWHFYFYATVYCFFPFPCLVFSMLFTYCMHPITHNALDFTLHVSDIIILFIYTLTTTK